MAVADQIVVFNNSSATIDLLANDSDPDGDTLELVSVEAPTHGTVVTNADGTVTYRPKSGMVGGDSFSYVVSDGTAQTTGQVTVDVRSVEQNQTVWPERFFAPYVDATLTSGYNMVDAALQHDVKFFTLAFVVADPRTGAPSWGGFYDTADGYRKDEIDALRAVGGDVMLSFGGAANTELAVAIKDVDQLTAAYQSVIDQYSLTYIDFDVEGAWVRDRESIDRRSLAIKNLQETAAIEGRPLEVWYTLPVLPTGLTPDGVYVLQSALDAGVEIAGVNVMAMDYGDSAAPNPEGQMGRYAIDAGESLKSQLEVLYQNAGIARTDEQLYRMVGVTPMIGQNDVNTERFYQQDAQQLLDWAEDKNIGMLSMWSATRDSAGSGLSPTHSGISQTAGEFHNIFAPFTGDSVPSIRVSDASVVEGDSGVARLEFSVTLNQPHDVPVSVNYSTAEGSADASDFVATSGSLTFAPGETQKTVVVDVQGDAV
ncbi:MAG: Ig-like domain-containing protein, partial [Pirellulales bacterium]|nr:Ig-like domain-containing protein [Pirellulales bacterium]